MYAAFWQYQRKQYADQQIDCVLYNHLIKRKMIIVILENEINIDRSQITQFSFEQSNEQTDADVNVKMEGVPSSWKIEVFHQIPTTTIFTCQRNIWKIRAVHRSDCQELSYLWTMLSLNVRQNNAKNRKKSKYNLYNLDHCELNRMLYEPCVRSLQCKMCSFFVWAKSEWIRKKNYNDNNNNNSTELTIKKLIVKKM